jgi:hypothetical protein
MSPVTDPTGGPVTWENVVLTVVVGSPRTGCSGTWPVDGEPAGAISLQQEQADLAPARHRRGKRERAAAEVGQQIRRLRLDEMRIASRRDGAKIERLASVVDEDLQRHVAIERDHVVESIRTTVRHVADQQSVDISGVGEEALVWTDRQPEGAVTDVDKEEKAVRVRTSRIS